MVDIIKVTPDNYDEYEELMETSRHYREKYLWMMEYLYSPIDDYRKTDKEKTSFIAVTKNGKQFVGKEIEKYHT